MKKLFTRLIAAALVFVSSACATVHAADMTDHLENKLIDALFRGVSYTMPTTLAVALHTAACSDSSAGTEVTTSGSTGYLRVALNPSTSNWASTGGAGTTTNPSAGTGGTTSNNSAITFPPGAP